MLQPSTQREFANLIERVRGLESASQRQAAHLRRWRGAACVLVGVLILSVLAGGAAVGHGVLEANALVLRAPDGTLRGSFVVGDDGGVRLTLLDAGSNPRAGMWLDRLGNATAWGFDNLSAAGQTMAQPASQSMATNNRPQFNGAPPVGTVQSAMMERATLGASPMLTSNRTPTSMQHTMPHSGRPAPAPPQSYAAPGGSMQYHQPAYEQTLPAPYTNGKLITLSTSARVLEQNRESWTYGYQLALRNDTGQDVDQAFHVIFVDASGFVLGRQARVVRLGPGRETMLTGEVALSPDRAQQVAAVKLTVWEP